MQRMNGFSERELSSSPPAFLLAAAKAPAIRCRACKACHWAHSVREVVTFTLAILTGTQGLQRNQSWLLMTRMQRRTIESCLCFVLLYSWLSYIVCSLLSDQSLPRERGAVV